MIKYIFSLFLLFNFLISSDEKSSFDTSEVTYQAEQDSEKEANSKPMAAWTGGSTLASFLLSPLIGGTISIVAGFSSAGNVEIPTKYEIIIKEKYGDNFDALRLYSEVYKDNYSKIIKSRQGQAALSGTAGIFVFNLLLLSGM